MRILFLYMFPLWGNGSGSYLRELARELVARGHDVAIVSPDERKVPGVRHFLVHPLQIGIFAGHPELPKAKKLEEMNGKEIAEMYASYLITASNAAQAFQPDLVHSFHTAFLPGIARFLKTLYGTKFIITTHGSDLSYLTRDKRFIGLIKDANQAAAAITAVSDFTRRHYLSMFGRKLKRKMSVITGGVDISDYKEDQKAIETIEKEFHLTGKKVVLFTGRLTEHKGVHYLVRAAKHINATIVIVGDGPMRKQLEREARATKLKNVIFTGYISRSNIRRFNAFYERADVFVMPSIWEEPFGLTLVEAMAAHTPVVATKRGGVVSIIKDKQNGFFIPARNSRQMATVVNTLIADEVLSKKLGESAYKTVLERFTWKIIASKFEVLYQRVNTPPVKK